MPDKWVKAIRIDRLDNVATAVEDIAAGEEISLAGESVSLQALEFIPEGHKVAVEFIAQGSAVLKYGQPIGSSLKNIEAGKHVHVHNLESNRGRGDLESGKGDAVCN
jgi:altronate dehydratase small subunit